MKTIREAAEAVENWYWEYGSKREGSYVLTRGGWLDRVKRIISEDKAIQASFNEYSKPTMALWGPSQAGKSTLLAEFIDAGADKEGHGSALSWDEHYPARFSGNLDDCPSVLNPYNQGADASGCVTRFQLAKEIKHPEYPVELKFATEAEILLSLAVGYLSETEAKDRNGNRVQLDAVKLDECTRIATEGKSADAPPDRRVYGMLTELMDVMDVLIDMEEMRYINLKREWKMRRGSILNNDVLAADEEALMKLAEELLWDGWPGMSELYRKLHAKRKELESLFGEKVVYCSIDIASLMLNIDSARQYNQDESVRKKVDQCRVKTLPGSNDIAISGLGEGDALFHGDIDFALTQGLVSLMLVKLRDDVMQRNTSREVYELLQKADLVDFPGVANEHKSAELLRDEQLDLGYKEKDGERKLRGLTQVLKRGKTASIVVSNSRNLNIDVFSLLVRMPAGPIYPGNPTQLMNGIRSWFKAMGKETNPLARDRELQINLILTFSAELINMVQESGVRTGLDGVFSKLKGMGNLADPELVSTFCVNYPQFCKIDASGEELENILRKVSEDKHFRKRFSNSGNPKEVLSRMADVEAGQYGGRTYLFESMLKQLETSKRRTLLARKREALQRWWMECMREALPGGDGGAKRKSDIRKLLDALGSKYADEIQPTARDILLFQDIDPETMDIFPRKHVDKAFIEKQVNNWIDAAKEKPLQEHLGFEDQEHRTRVLSYLRARIVPEEVVDWLEELGISGMLTHTSGRQECRRLLATYFTSRIFPRDKEHRKETDCLKLLENMVGGQGLYDVKQLPHHIAIIEPFMETLKKLSQEAGEERGPQPGDDELQKIIED